MDDEELCQTKVLITYDYPHQILIHILKILKKKKRDFLQQESLFLAEFQKRFPKETEEYRILLTGYRLGIISGFAENATEPEWKKRVFIQKSLFLMQKSIRECDAVMLLESLMNVFHWHFTIEAKRKWKVSAEDKANFHAFQKPEHARDNNSFQEESRISHKKQYKERNPHFWGENQTDDQNQPLSFHAEERGSFYQNIENTDFPYDEVAEVLQTLEENQSEKKYNIFIIEDNRTISSPKEVKHYSKMRSSDRKHIKKALNGNQKSQCYLGDFYSEEATDHLDYPEAVYWYQLSANQGNYKARMQLATIYDSGLLEGKDTKHRGIECFRQLAEEGFPTAQCILGMKYFFGDGVEENRSIAVKWLKKAAAQGHDEAIKLLNRFRS